MLCNFTHAISYKEKLYRTFTIFAAVIECQTSKIMDETINLIAPFDFYIIVSPKYGYYERDPTGLMDFSVDSNE